MVNKCFIFFIFFVNICFGQEVNSNKYIKLSQFEFQDIFDSIKHISGNFYIISSKRGEITNIDIKKYLNGKKTGEWLAFSNTLNGLDLVSVSNYKNGILHGYYFLTNNHTESQEGIYKQGKKNGHWKFIKVVGGHTVELEGHFKNGKKHGKWVKVNLELQEKETITFKNGKKHGKYYFENKEYKTSITGEYKNDLKHGVWVTKDKLLPIINSDGTTSQNLKTEYFKNGILITK